jgi:hypothetical protein
LPKKVAPLEGVHCLRHWKDHDAYQKTLTLLLRDLRIEAT